MYCSLKNKYEKEGDNDMIEGFFFKKENEEEKTIHGKEKFHQIKK